VLVGVLEGIGEGVKVGSNVFPGVGVTVGNIWTAPTQDERNIEASMMSVL
jgi:hypothetical protein